MELEANCMSLRDKARARIESLDAAQVRALIRRRLMGDDTAPLGTQHDLEPSENFVIELLIDDRLPAEKRVAVIAGCEEIYGEVLRWLAQPTNTGDAPDWVDTTIRLCRVVDMAKPAELSRHVTWLLSPAMDSPRIDMEVRAAAFRAAMAYSTSKDQYPLWERVLGFPELAAYGFNAILTIDPQSYRVEACLRQLWVRQLEEDWPIDCAFLTRRAARESGSNRLTADVIQWLADKYHVGTRPVPTWAKLIHELDRRDWSREWLRGIVPTGLASSKDDPNTMVMRLESRWGATRLVRKHFIERKLGAVGFVAGSRVLVNSRCEPWQLRERTMFEPTTLDALATGQTDVLSGGVGVVGVDFFHRVKAANYGGLFFGGVVEEWPNFEIDSDLPELGSLYSDYHAIGRNPLAGASHR